MSQLIDVAIGTFGAATIFGSAFGLFVVMNSSIVLFRREGLSAAAKDFAIPGGAALYGLVIGLICLIGRSHWKLILAVLELSGLLGLLATLIYFWGRSRKQS